MFCAPGTMAVSSQERVVSKGLVRLFAAALSEHGSRLWWPYCSRALLFLHSGLCLNQGGTRGCRDITRLFRWRALGAPVPTWPLGTLADFQPSLSNLELLSTDSTTNDDDHDHDQQCGQYCAAQPSCVATIESLLVRCRAQPEGGQRNAICRRQQSLPPQMAARRMGHEVQPVPHPSDDPHEVREFCHELSARVRKLRCNRRDNRSCAGEGRAMRDTKAHDSAGASEEGFLSAGGSPRRCGQPAAAYPPRKPPWLLAVHHRHTPHAVPVTLYAATSNNGVMLYTNPAASARTATTSKTTIDSNTKDVQTGTGRDTTEERSNKGLET